MELRDYAVMGYAEQKDSEAITFDILLADRVTFQEVTHTRTFEPMNGERVVIYNCPGLGVEYTEGNETRRVELTFSDKYSRKITLRDSLPVERIEKYFKRKVKGLMDKLILARMEPDHAQEQLPKVA